MTRRSNRMRVWIVIVAIAVYLLGTGPMTVVIARLNHGTHAVTRPLRLLLLPYWPLYRALDYAPRPIVAAWITGETLLISGGWR